MAGPLGPTRTARVPHGAAQHRPPHESPYELDDWKRGSPSAAASLAEKLPEPPEVTELRARLGPPDPTTNALLANYRARVTCPDCGWTGAPPDPRLP